MRRTRAMAAAATMFAVLAAAGCSGGSSGGGSATASPPANGSATGEPAPPQSSTASTPPSSKSSSTTATPKPSGTAAGAPGVPEAARQHTPAGAVAFARHYWDTVNDTAEKPTIGVLDRLATKACKTCENFADTVRSNVENRQRFSGPEGNVLKAEWRVTAVWMKIEPMDLNLLDTRTGAVVKRYPKDSIYVWVVDLKWTATGWRVNSMQVADSSSW